MNLLSHIEHRAALAGERIQTRIDHATAVGRDLSTAEMELCDADRAELAELHEAQRTQTEVTQRTGIIQRAMDEHVGVETRQALDQFAQLLKARAPGRVELFERAATTAVAGARRAVDAATSRPGYVHELAGIAMTPASALVIEGPYFPLYVARAATAEGTTKPVMSDPTLKSVTLGAYADTIDVSDQVVRFGVGLNVIGQRLQAEVIYSVNAAVVDAFETEASTAIAFAGTASSQLDKAIATVVDRTGNYPSLAVVNPADWPLFTEKLGRDSAEDIGSKVIEWNGVPIIANAAMTAGFAVVVDGTAWTAHGTNIFLDTLPDLSTNKIKARAEQYFAVMPHYAGAAVAIDIVTP